VTDALDSRRPPDLDSLDALVGIWHVTGGSSGTVRHEWMDGKHFMLQYIDLDDYSLTVLRPERMKRA
jgi:hypothetical protein